MKIIHPYTGIKKYPYKASLHNHSMFRPDYTHAPVLSDVRLTEYRDYNTNPPYGAVAITEHNRTTVPWNTDPIGETNPPWGVEGILWLIGNEKVIGTTNPGHPMYGDFLYGEVGVVNMPLPEGESDAGYAHYNYHGGYVNSEFALTTWKGMGGFLTLNHPNSRISHPDEIQPWDKTGWTYDQLDMLYGNKSKNIEGYPEIARPHALEIGNQAYDFSARTAYKNAEPKWDYLLSQGHNVFGTATDDAHGNAAFGGWVVVYTNSTDKGSLEFEDVMDSLLNGNFYSSQGPNMDININGRLIEINTDKPSTIEFIIQDGEVIQSTQNVSKSNYLIKGFEKYVRVRVTREDSEWTPIAGGIGRKRSAWSNAIWVESDIRRGKSSAKNKGISTPSLKPSYVPEFR